MAKEIASALIRVYPSTRRRLRMQAAKKNTTIAEIVDSSSKKKVIPQM